MRLSSVQIFQQGIASIMSQQAKLDHTQQQLASGKKVLSPADDPVAAVQVLNITEDLKAIDQYQRNSNMAEAQLALEDATLDRVGNVLQRVRELVVQANNASQGPDTRRGIAAEIAARMDELQSLANTTDANGEYIFAGFQARTEPFAKQGGSVIYMGDDGQRYLQVGSSSQVAVRDSGADVFERVPSGNGVFAVAAGAGNSGTAVAGQTSSDGAFVRDNYSISFSQASPGDPVTYQVVDSSAGVVASGNYEAGEVIAFAGASVRFDGVPADGDSFSVTPSVNKGVFSMIEGIVNDLNGFGGAPADVAQLNTSMGQALNDLDQALENVLQVRAEVGVRQQQVETQLNINESFNLQLEESLSGIQDLDYAEAISRFNLELTALQAAQQAYAKMQGMSLFNYIQ